MSAQAFTNSISRQIKAPVKKVWDAWADKYYWSEWVMMTITNDFRVGGKYDNGKGEGGEYKEIKLHEKISFTWNMKRYIPGSYVEVSFLSIDDKTTLCTLTHQNLQAESDRADSELGWSWAMDSLQAFLETGKPVSWEAWEKQKK